ncbi:MAG: glycoside hydrolase family 57 protein [archaeon]
MVSLALEFEVHQPRRVGQFPEIPARAKPAELGKYYFDSETNRTTFRKVATKCYLPTTFILLKLIDRFKGRFKVSFSLTGTFIEQAEEYAPEVLDNFRLLAETGAVEFIDETYYHSLSSLYGTDRGEFIEQVREHGRKIKELFGQSPKIFRNTEFIFNNAIAKTVAELGYKAIYTEGIDWILHGWKSPNHLYTVKDAPGIFALLRNYKLSDDIGYRFSARWWNEWPLTAEKYAAWLSEATGDFTNICIDFETFGEHQWTDTGIFSFLEALPEQVLKYPQLSFATPSELVGKFMPVGEIDVFEYSTISWADLERDTSAWLGNRMQQIAFEEIKKLGPLVLAAGDKDLIRAWRLLQTSDHYYYMCTKWLGDGDVHSYFAHIKNPYEAYANFIAILADLKSRAVKVLEEKGIESN